LWPNRFGPITAAQDYEAASGASFQFLVFRFQWMRRLPRILKSWGRLPKVAAMAGGTVNLSGAAAGGNGLGRHKSLIIKQLLRGGCGADLASALF